MNKIKKIIIFSNPECDNNFEYAKKIAALAKKSGIEVYADEKYRKELEGFDMDFIEEKDIPSLNADIAISLGGDGSMLDVSEKTAASACPVLGINLGNLGFLTALEKSEFLQ